MLLRECAKCGVETEYEDWRLLQLAAESIGRKGLPGRAMAPIETGTWDVLRSEQSCQAKAHLKFVVCCRSMPVGRSSQRQNATGRQPPKALEGA